MEKAIQCLTKNYANFSGRASRSEYWLFILFTFIVSFVLVLIDMAAGTYDAHSRHGLLSGIFSLIVIIPSLAVGVRRLHDIDKSGWWLFISIIPIIGGIYLFVLNCTKGTEGSNRFGEDPLQT